MILCDTNIIIEALKKNICNEIFIFNHLPFAINYKLSLAFNTEL